MIISRYYPRLVNIKLSPILTPSQIQSQTTEPSQVRTGESPTKNTAVHQSNLGSGGGRVLNSVNPIGGARRIDTGGNDLELLKNPLDKPKESFILGGLKTRHNYQPSKIKPI